MNICIREETDSLPGDYRAAILLHDLEGLTAVETVEMVGGSLATAKIRIHRARQRSGRPPRWRMFGVRRAYAP